MVSRIAFVALVFLVGAQRLWELRLSARHEARLRAEGAVEHAPEQMRWMRAVHGGWLACSALEVLLLDRPFVPWLAALAGAFFLVGQLLRYAAMRALGWRWNVKILTLPGRAPVSRGIFRYLRHPNYLGVILEIASLPLIHGAWISALVFSAANGALLARRIRAEEAALDASGDYGAKLGSRPRLWPRVKRDG